jgi:lipopolysaccharide biosynthesis glycosyltransferase
MRVDMSQCIPIFFTFDENYVLPAAVALRSLLRNANPRYRYRLYVVTAVKQLSARSQRRLAHIVDRFSNASLEFRHVDLQVDNFWEVTNKGHYSREVFLKLSPASMFPEHDWILCSDVDVVFTGDVSEVLAFMPWHHCIAGVRSIKKLDEFIDTQPYTQCLKERLKGGIGGGFIAYNLNSMRRNGIEERLSAAFREHAAQLRQAEQDVLNLALRGEMAVLPLRFLFCNYMYSAVRKGPLCLRVDGRWLSYLMGRYMHDIEADEYQSESDVRDAFLSPVQVHYAGPAKPWNTLLCYRKLDWLYHLAGTGYLLEHLAKGEISNAKTFAARKLRGLARRLRDAL